MVSPTTQPADCNSPAICPNIGRMDRITNTAVKGEISRIGVSLLVGCHFRETSASHGFMPEPDGRNLPEHCAARGGSENTTTEKEGKGSRRTFLPLTGVFHMGDVSRFR